MYIVRNACAKIRIKTTDDHILRAFSFFYPHPKALDESQWKLFNGILVDVPSMKLLSLHTCRWLTDKQNTIIGVELSTELTGSALDEHQRMCKAYIDHIRDHKDTDQLVNDLEKLLIS